MPSSRLKSCPRLPGTCCLLQRDIPEPLRDKTGGLCPGVAVGVGVHAVKSGQYQILASLQKESGYEVGLFDRTMDLTEGNHSVVVEFNARNFGNLDDGTRLFLRDLVITEEDETIDEIADAWSSGEMNFGR
jgi:hypothetical protein